MSGERMQIITTHVNSDFDCLASLMAAKKLYPNAVVAFSGSQEKQVRNYLKRHPLPFECLKPKQVDLRKVSHLILVDVNRNGKIGYFKPVGEKPEIPVTVFDHHPFGHSGHPSDEEVVRERGSTSTIFVEILRERGIPVNPAEATLLALGIYEDTGSLTFPSTTPEDLTAVSWLLTQGADLNVVADYIRSGLDGDQIALLNDLLGSIRPVSVHGIPVFVATASTDHYVEDLALVTQRLRDTQGADVLFVAARMGDRVCLVARSRLKALDVGKIAARFGGGGHPTAAAATVRDLTLVQVRDRLLEYLQDELFPAKRASDLLTRPAVTVEETDPIQTAEQVLTRFNFSTVPVLKNGRPAGLIDRKIVEKAIHHEMSGEPVSDFMIHDFKTAFPDTPFTSLEEWILEQKQKLVPVSDPATGALIGVVSRGDLLRSIYGELQGPPQRIPEDTPDSEKVYSGKNLKSMILERMPTRVAHLLRTIQEAADEFGCTAFAVGGFVRDLLLGIPNFDIDVVVEGDGIEFSKGLALRVKGAVKTHQKYKTAKVTFPDGPVIDVASARMEFYEFPGALPQVVFGSIKNDLYRRDFSINALAIYLNGPHAFHLLDFFQGKRDITEKVIRVLHNLSFVEDPTRILRAIRFEQRYQFSLGKQTEFLLKSAVEKGLLGRISGARIFNELSIMLKEDNPKKMIRRLDDFHVLRFIQPKIRYQPRLRYLFKSTERVLSWHLFTFPGKKLEAWLVYLLSLLDELTGPEAEETCTRLCVPQGLTDRILTAFANRKQVESLIEQASPCPPSKIYDLFHPFPLETVLYYMSRLGNTPRGRRVVEYLTELRETRPFLRGKDLLQIGLPPGEEFSRILKEVFSAQLDGKVRTREEGFRLARKLSEKKNAVPV